MRITKTKLKKKEARQIAKLVDGLITSEDFTLSTDFAEDAYALFKEEFSKRRIFKNYWELFLDIRRLYAKFKLGDLMKNVDFYNQTKSFFRYFIFSSLFRELDKLDPLEALEKFLKTFQPPQPLPKPQKQPKGGLKGGSGAQGQQKKQDSKQKGQGKQPFKSKKSKDKKGLSADKGNIPIDMTKFRQQLPRIEKMIDSGILDKEDFKKFISKQAGVKSEEITIGNIVNLIDKIATNVSEKELEIFYVARKREIIEKYRKDEVLESVPYPDNEMTIKNIDRYQELLKTIPTQYAFDDDIFMQKLLKKELLVRDYQSRRLKKQALYLLIDVSGSMEGNGKRKSIYASGVALAFVRQAISEGSVYFLRFFDDTPHELHRITTKKEAEKMTDILVKKPYSGGGTRIDSAIKQAVKDIVKDPVKFEKAEIMIITDGYDVVRTTKGELKKIKVHSTIIDGENDGLEAISKTYTEIKSSEL